MRSGLVLAFLVTGCGRFGFDDAKRDGALDGSIDARASFAVRIASANDDAEEFTDGEMYLDSTDLELCDDSTSPHLGQIIGLRFVGIPAPRGAHVLTATIQFTVEGPPLSGPGSLTLRGERLPSLPFTTAIGNLSSRQTTASSVAWSPVAWPVAGAAGADQRTPELAAIVEEILAQPVWTPGSAIALFVTGTGGNQAQAYEGSIATAALLELEYESEP